MVFIPQPNKDCRRSWFSPKASRGQTDGSEPSIRFQPILGARLTSTAVLELNIPTSTIYIPQAQTASMITGQATTIGANSPRLDRKSTYSAAEGGRRLRHRVSLDHAAHMRCRRYESPRCTRLLLKSWLLHGRLGLNRRRKARLRPVRRRLRHDGLIEGEGGELPVLANRHLGFAHFVRPFDAGNAITVDRCPCGQIFLEILVGHRGDRYHITIGRSCGICDVKVFGKVRRGL